MIFKDQMSQILVEESGSCTITHYGAIYPPDKVTCSSMVTDFIANVRDKGKYLNVIISGEVNHKGKEDKIEITSMKLSC